MVECVMEISENLQAIAQFTPKGNPNLSKEQMSSIVKQELHPTTKLLKKLADNVESLASSVRLISKYNQQPSASSTDMEAEH